MIDTLIEVFSLAIDTILTSRLVASVLIALSLLTSIHIAVADHNATAIALSERAHISSTEDRILYTSDIINIIHNNYDKYPVVVYPLIKGGTISYPGATISTPLKPFVTIKGNPMTAEETYNFYQSANNRSDMVLQYFLRIAAGSRVEILTNKSTNNIEHKAAAEMLRKIISNVSTPVNYAVSNITPGANATIVYGGYPLPQVYPVANNRLNGKYGTTANIFCYYRPISGDLDNAYLNQQLGTNTPYAIKYIYDENEIVIGILVFEIPIDDYI